MQEYKIGFLVMAPEFIAKIITSNIFKSLLGFILLAPLHDYMLLPYLINKVYGERIQ